MIVARQTFQAKYGRGDELAGLFREFNARMQAERPAGPRSRILTDISGPFFTVVTEIDVENLSAWETTFSEGMNRPWVGEWFGKMLPLVESGRRDFYTLVE